MRWLVVVPGALLPAAIAAELIAAAAAPQFDRLLRHAAAAPLAAPPLAFDGALHLAWLWHAFSGQWSLPVTAPYAWRALNEAPQTDAAAELWQADPVHFALARDHMLVTPLDDLAPADAAALAAEAAPVVAAAGAQLRLLAGHWFVAADRHWALHALPLEAAVGESALEQLPQGADAAHWRRQLTAVQMAWHPHPVNAAREARGQHAANGLWLHGGGTWAALPPTRFRRVASDAAAVRGWALAAGLAPANLLPAAAFERAPMDGDALIDWRGLWPAFKAEAWNDWLPAWRQFGGWLDALAARAFAAGADLELVLCGRRHCRAVTLARGDRWRAWRRHAPAQLVAEPMAA